MKRTVFCIALTLLAVFAWATIPAGPVAAVEKSNNDGYCAPVLVTSVRPEPVEYAPGRLVEGYVTLQIRVGVDGTAKSANVLYRTSATAVPSAVRAVEKWVFQPATMYGEPVEANVVYSLPFGRNLSIFANDEYPASYATYANLIGEDYAASGGSDCCGSPNCCPPADCCPAAASGCPSLR